MAPVRAEDWPGIVHGLEMVVDFPTASSLWDSSFPRRTRGRTDDGYFGTCFVLNYFEAGF